MFHVEFPGLGFSFQINSTAFKVVGHSFAWYGIIIAVGFLLAFLYVLKSSRRFHVDEDKLIDAVIIGIIGGIVGARAYYVIFDASSQYIKNPISILYIWNGGLGIYGGIIGGLICGALVAKHHKLSIGSVLDLASLGFLIGQCIGRWGNFVNQEAFGTATNLPWRMVSENTETISSTGVHPCFLYESIWCLLGFILLHIFSRKFRRYDGQVFLLYSLWYGVGRFWIEGLRTDSLITPYFPLRISQIVAAAAVIASVVLLIVFRGRTSLTGCGSAKIMELNSIVDEVKPGNKAETEDDGTSTIFESGEDAKKVMAGDSIRGETSEEKTAEDVSEVPKAAPPEAPVQADPEKAEGPEPKAEEKDAEPGKEEKK